MPSAAFRPCFRSLRAGLIAASVGLVPIVHAADASKAEAVKSIDEELTLERIFPEDSPFGPGRVRWHSPTTAATPPTLSPSHRAPSWQ